jgi:hypothetical protein
MQRDLEHGFVGHLDELVPDLIQDDDSYFPSCLPPASTLPSFARESVAFCSSDKLVK